MKIPFNKPYLTGKEAHYIYQAVLSGKISGNGQFTKKCHNFFENKYNFNKVLLTSSCTDALEMSALLLRLKEGDEVIVPSFTFVSTANAFLLRGAKIVFADSEPNNPNIDPSKIEALITERTKAIAVVHYAGVACDMDAIMDIAKSHNLAVVEDAAQAIDSFYKGRPLGGIGHLAAFSFHDTKNIIAGEGGMLVVNDDSYANRAEIIWEKGTNRSAFFRGEVDKYNWVDIGSSFLPSDTIAAFLYAQVENIDQIQGRRRQIWSRYFEGLEPLQKEGYLTVPYIPPYATNNGHMFYLVCKSLEERTALIEHLKSKGVYAVFHYLCLHASPYFVQHHDGRPLPNAKKFEDGLLRLPFFFELTDEEISMVIAEIHAFYKK